MVNGVFGMCTYGDCSTRSPKVFKYKCLVFRATPIDTYASVRNSLDISSNSCIAYGRGSRLGEKATTIQACM